MSEPLKWTSDLPKVTGWYWVRYPNGDKVVWDINPCQIKHPEKLPDVGEGFKCSGPIPEPQEPTGGNP